MDRILKTLTLVPDEYFRNRNNMDESIYVYLDRNQFIIDAKGKIFRNKRTDKQITIEIADNEICRTKKETLEKFQKKSSSKGDSF